MQLNTPAMDDIGRHSLSKQAAESLADMSV
jgi:hypothetical protein